MISVGVFLGLLGEQSRETAHQRELAKQSLQRFRAEIVENRDAVAAVAEYHATVHKELQAALEKGPERASRGDIDFHGIRPAALDRTAWDLAIATQSLTYIDPELALSLAKVYNQQETLVELTHGLTQAMYVNPAINESNSMTFFSAVLVYYGDATIYEPRRIEMYDAILPKIASALGEKRQADYSVGGATLTTLIT